MTQDYKTNLLEYLTGNITEEPNVNTPIFNQQIDTLNNNIVNNAETILINEENAQSVVFLGKIYNDSYGVYLIYGYYIDTSTNYYGFIYLVDNELNEIEMITTFESGTKLFPITALNQDENNNIYGLSYNTSTTTSRVLLLNNIFASGLLDGDYKCILRNDYVVPYSYSQSPYRQNRIIKSPDGATYYMVFNGTSNTKIVKFTINVGSTNDWEEYTANEFFTSQFCVFLDKSSGEEIFYLYGIDASSPSVYYEYQLEGTTLTKNKQIALSGTANFVYSQVFVKNNNETYLSVCDTTAEALILYILVNDNLIEIYRKNLYHGDGFISLSYLQLFEINGGVFAFIKYREDTNCYLSVGYLRGNTLDIYNIGQSDNTPLAGLYDYVDFYYSTNYNLVRLYAPIYSTNDTTTKLTFDYNSNNYNGVAYKGIETLLPVKGRLFDSNNKMIFARNLYNKTINSNTTISTINVPNTNLNEVTIAKQYLIGKTNYELVNNTQNITKNIYENLNINFYTTLNMSNENNPDNPIFNQLGSNRINLSVSNLLDYNNTKATKFKINYSDGTYLTQPIQPSQITYSNGIYTYTFMIYVPKQITNIQIISNDESTVYQTITGTFEINKYYLITQDVRIGG